MIREVKERALYPDYVEFAILQMFNLLIKYTEGEKNEKVVVCIGRDNLLRYGS
jgi:hypothetical protein